MRPNFIVAFFWFFSVPSACLSAETIELRGRIVCLAEEMQKVHQATVPVRHDHLLGFKTTDGSYYTLLRTHKSVALFLDDRLREKELILKGLLFPKSCIFESHTMKSLKDGVVHDLFYYCDICSIESVTPEECACCQQPVRLIERSLEKK